MKKINLNELKIDNETADGIPLSDFSVKLIKPQFDEVELVLRNIEDRLIELIYQYKDDVIFGCIAWLTSKPILEALAECKNVQIIVQKEDFLRPDLHKIQNNKWKSELSKLYKNVKFYFDKYDCRYPICELSVCGDPSIDPIRCIGNHNSSKSPAFPRAHHKFLVFCRLDDRIKNVSWEERIGEANEAIRKNNETNYKPITVWAGSFNFTANASNSFENVLVLTDNCGDNKIINSYLQEHHQLYALSEPLNWEQDWSEPEFRIGT